MSRVLIGNIKGPKGDAATIGVGEVTTGAPGTSATVTNSGTSDAAILDFRIPKGDKGDPGDPGVNDYASSSAAGLVRVGDDVAVDSSSGILSLNSTNITEASSVSNINSGDSYRTILGKLKKFISTLSPSNFLINTVNSNAADKGLTANMGNKLAGDIATVQTSNTATRNFAVGEYIVYNGIMYKVTTAIASGGTLTPGTNLTATNAGAQLKSLNDSLAKFSLTVVKPLHFVAAGTLTYTSVSESINLYTNAEGTIGFINGYVNMIGATFTDGRVKFKLTGSGLSVNSRRDLGFSVQALTGPAVNPTAQNIGSLFLETTGEFTSSIYMPNVSDSEAGVRFFSCLVLNPK